MQAKVVKTEFIRALRDYLCFCVPTATGCETMDIRLVWHSIMLRPSLLPSFFILQFVLGLHSNYLHILICVTGHNKNGKKNLCPSLATQACTAALVAVTTAICQATVYATRAQIWGSHCVVNLFTSSFHL